MKAGIQIEKTRFRVKPGMTIKEMGLILSGGWFLKLRYT
jgi:hypothetical protein